MQVFQLLQEIDQNGSRMDQAWSNSGSVEDEGL